MDVKAALISLGKDFAYKMQKKNIAAFAGSCAYFFIISIVPLLILISSTLPYTAVTEADLVKALTDITPDFADGIILKLIDEAYEQSVAVFSISALATIWSGALGMLSIIRGLNCIYDVEERRNYFHLRFIAALYTLAMIAIMLVMLLIMVFERVVRNIAVSHFPSIMFVISLSSYLKFLVVIAVSTFFFALIYTFVPSAKMTFVYQLPGAIFSAVVWYLFSWLFSIYVNMSGYFSVYGSIATPLIMMIWLYFCISIFLIGAFINRFFHPAVKVLYDDHHQRKVREKAKKKSTRQLRKPRKYNEFG
ncbi:MULTISPECIES: YihY/virulence factor BrkB family protein [unclassified Butyrivibrio]|uniref:YihY/virulence factor BrkB family protein n=1 Tax=unclassified Butyrivibrio TaxID=2639466 RepID=UPI0003B67279|nr:MULTISPECIES: YihY/virulence factor BrkB family protein [unclassified Butyrivibrio]